VKISNAVALPRFWGSATQDLFSEQRVLERYRCFPVALPRALKLFFRVLAGCVFDRSCITFSEREKEREARENQSQRDCEKTCTL
jgi:hypothetical protein